MGVLEQILHAIEKVRDEYPYKVPGDPETYSRYNEAWQDCADKIGSRITELLSDEDMNVPINEDCASEELKTAADKQKPMKPEYEGDGYADGQLVYDTWICPNCGERYEVDYDDYAYCPKCGQAIDWKEDE